MSENRKTRGVAALLILLATASFAAAAITITNITEWYIIAREPPIYKVAGLDIGQMSDYIGTEVEYYGANDGTYRVKIYLTGFIGDPTQYDSALRICNRDNIPYKVKLVYNNTINPYDWNKVQYVVIWLNNKDNKIKLPDGPSETDIVIVERNKCVDVGAEILVKPNASDNQTVVAFVVNVVSQPSPPSP